MPSRDVVCIARAVGASGEEIGRLVAERLGYRYVDEEVILEAAARAGLDPEVVADAERRKPLFVGLLEYLGDASEAAAAFADTPRIPDEVVRGHIRGAVADIARDGDVVIVAHAGSHALADDPRQLRVLVTAPEETRAARIAGEESLSAGDAARAVRKSDAARADYLKRFYGVGREQPTDYDLVINTERLSPDDAAELVVRALERG